MGPKYRVGIDVGGTNTDAVILAFDVETTQSQPVVAWHKTATTPDVTDGIALALETVLQKSGISPSDILYLSIGTTHFLNAIIEADGRRLAKVAVIRLAAPYTVPCPPFIDFPPQLRKILEGHIAVVDGGLEIDGKEIRPINRTQILQQWDIIKAKGINTVVVVGVFSPLASKDTQEEYVKSIIEEAAGKGNINVVCSKDVGHVGLLERENAAILNAAILSFARRTVKAYQQVLTKLNLHCPMYLTQLDGTLISAPLAAQVPIRTFSNGPTNSMRGASYLAGLQTRGQRLSTIVIDVGGTTTDVGVLLPSGFPRKAAAYTDVAGVRTSFSMPDIHSIGLGGGSRVKFGEDGSAQVGPDSVGLDIQQDALVFGGSQLTATDLAIAAGLPTDIQTEQVNNLPRMISQDQITSGISVITRKLEAAIDKMKTDPGDATVLLVGGGSIIVPPTLRGVANIIRPPFFGVANAVGAAIARVAGVVDRIEIPEKLSIHDIVENCKKDAVQQAIALGAAPSTVEIAEVTVIQLPYVANHASRIIIRAVGDLDVDAVQSLKADDDGWLLAEIDVKSPLKQESEKVFSEADFDKQKEDIVSYKPNVSADGVWSLSELDIEWIAEGCAVLGCGGGGATYAAFLMARQILREGRQIRVVDHTYFANSDGWVQPCGFMGSPSVSSERIPSGEEIPTACLNLKKYLGISEVVAIVSDEIGGKNGLEPMLLASRPEYDCPVIDGDLMGRAYPRLNQILPCIYKENGLYPVAAADGVGNCMLVPAARSNHVVEDVLRAACTVLGSSIALAISPLPVSEFRQLAIIGTTSQAWRIGRAIALSRHHSTVSQVANAITALQDGKCLFIGKITDVQREVKGGFTFGQLTIAPLSEDELESGPSTIPTMQGSSDRLIVPFQNENLQAFVVKEDGSSKTLCSVPDLIAVLDSQNGSSIGTQDYRYGLRVTVIGLSCDPRWTTAKGLEIGGPHAFGLNCPYAPIGIYSEPRSVIMEYSSEVA